MRFLFGLGDGYALTPYTLDLAAPMHALIEQNIERLRRWEPWAQPEQTVEDVRAYTRAQLEKWLSGEAVPCAIVRGEGSEVEPVGSITLTVDGYRGIGEIGYWIDAGHEGRGVVTRACAALIEHGRSLGLQRFELRISTENERSAAVAARLGFVAEGVLRAAMPVGERRHDVTVFGLVPHSSASAEPLGR